jgi:hypothetical protein
MAQWLRALTVLPKVPSSDSTNHMVAYNICNEIRCPLLVCLKTVCSYKEKVNLFFFFFFFLVFRDRVSLYSPGCPGTYSVDQAGLELRNPPASAP